MSAVFVIQGTAAIAAGCNAPGSVPGTPLYQGKGQALPGAPKSTVNTGFTYAHSITNSVSGDFSSSYYYRSATWNAAGDTTTIEPGYGIVNLNTGLSTADSKLRVGLFVRNLADKHFSSGLLSLPFANPGGVVNWETREGRRTVGVSIEGKF